MRREVNHKPWLIGVGVLALAALACTCGPLASLTGQVEATVQAVTAPEDPFDVLAEIEATMEAAATLVEEDVPTVPAPPAEPEAIGEAQRQWAVNAMASTQYGESSWSALQATGAPDTPECGDITTAWASATSSGVDWLRLEYAVAVIPSQINIYQTYNPGAVYRVEVTDTSGATRTVYETAPAAVPVCPYVLTVDVTGVDTPVQSVTVHIDQSNHTGWNEIDAVELVGTTP
jgi:hypothetical protein